jgi:hypothetical protein
LANDKPMSRVVIADIAETAASFSGSSAGRIG